MKHPLQALAIDPDNKKMQYDVVSGRKKISIRDGHRDYRPGQIVLFWDPYCVTADIMDVRHCTYGEIGEEEYRADGFVSQADMIKGMRGYYPHVDLDKSATVIRWENARGKLVEEYQEKMKCGGHKG